MDKRNSNHILFWSENKNFYRQHALNGFTKKINPIKALVICLLVQTFIVGFTGISPAQNMQSGEQPLLIDYTWKEDFGSGTISSWFSYPLFQDTAFDFTIIPGYYRPQNHLQGYVRSGEYFYPVDLAPPETDDGYYLLRSYRPNSAGPQKIGIAYKKKMWASGMSTFEFDYWLRYPVDADGDLRIDLSGKDGHRYQAFITAPERAQWKKARIELREFVAEDGTPFTSTVGIDAVAMVLEIDRGVPSEYVYIAVDNIRLDGFRQAGFELISPESIRFNHWPVQFARKHVQPGSELQLELRSEAELMEVKITVLDLAGEAISSPVRLINRDNNQWMSIEPYTLPSEALGPLTLRVEGLDSEGHIASSDVRLWNLGDPGQERPRVMMTENDRNLMLEKIASEPRFAEIWERISNRAENARENPFPDEITFHQWDTDYLFGNLSNWFEQMRRDRVEDIFYNAFVWFIDGNIDARDYAIEGMLNMAGWEQWIHPWFPAQGRASYYPLGHAVMSIGIAYDLLYHELSEEQRAIIRRGVMENGIIPTWQEYFEDNRIPNHTSNWISMAAGGSFIGLMAFYDELEQDGWEMDGEPWFSGLAEKFLAMSKATVLPDGSYGEGIGYQHITYSHAQEFVAILDHMFGVKGGLADVLYYDIGHLFWLYISLDRTHDALSMGDSNPRRDALDNWSWFARESKDPVMKWFYAQRPGMSWPALLWDDIHAHLQGIPPEEHYPNSRVFPDKGNVVFRTGWENNDAVFVYRAGPFFNHTHFDQGNFRFFALGEELITESGRASYYNDPYFWSYFIQAAGHNTVLIDDYPESQHAGDYNNEITSFDNYATITDALVSNDIGFVVSELAPVYYADIESYIRRIWFADPGYAILEDRIVSAGTPHTYHLQLHPPDLGTLEINDNGKNALIRNGEAELRVQVVAPKTPRLLAKRYPFANRHITHDTPLHSHGVLQVTHDDPLVEQTFRLVLAPYKEDSGMPDTITEIEGINYRGVEFGFNDGRVDRIYYTEDEDQGIFHTDARSAFISLDANGVLRSLAMEGATHFTFENRFSFSAEAPVHTSLNLVDGGDRIRLSGGIVEDGDIRASFTTNAGGTLILNTQEKGASKLIDSSSERGQTTVNVILSGGPLEIDILD